MLKLPKNIILTDGTIIDNASCLSNFDKGFYWLETTKGAFPIFQLEGRFYSGVSSVTSSDSLNEPVFLSNETLSLIKLNDQN